MDDQISRRDLPAESVPPAELLRAVPESTPPAPPREKKRPGPKTAKSKARVRLNTMRSGIYAKGAVIPGERLEDRQAHDAAVLASFDRPTYIDTRLAERVASASWNLKRVERYQETEFARANDGSPVFLMPPGTEQDKITRADGHWSVQFFKALHELEAREKRRRGEAAPLARLDVQGEIEPVGIPDGGGGEQDRNHQRITPVDSWGVRVTADRRAPGRKEEKAKLQNKSAGPRTDKPGFAAQLIVNPRVLALNR